jgi:hypothetical protein
MSGAVIASPSTYLSITLINRNSARLEARQGHGLLGKSLFRNHQSLTLPDVKFALLNPLHRDVVLLSAFSRGLLKLARQNLLRCRIRVFGILGKKDLLLQPHLPTSDRRFGTAQAGRHLVPSTWLET